MPVVSTGPFDTANSVLNLARVLVNDAALGIAGNLLANTQPYTFEYLNSAYRTLQKQLRDAGVEYAFKETQLLLLPAVAAPDPTVQVYIDFTGSYNGTTFSATPVLPADLVTPLRLWERPSNTNAYFSDMFPASDGMESRQQTSWLFQWEWRSQKLYMIGSLAVEDLRLRYIPALPDLTDGDSEVLILESKEAIAYYVAAQWAGTRGSPLADTLFTQGKMYADKMINATSRKTQRAQHRRIPYSRRGGGARNFGTW